jgi:hypothetical protein
VHPAASGQEPQPEEEAESKHERHVKGYAFSPAEAKNTDSREREQQRAPKIVASAFSTLRGCF